MSVAPRQDLAPDAARATLRARSAGLARVPAAVLAAAAEDDAHERIAFALVEALVRACDARRVVLGCALEPDAPLALLALSGQSRVDPRRRSNRRLVDTLDAAPAPEADAHGVGADLVDGGGASCRAARAFVRDGVGGRVALLLERDADRPWDEAEARAVALVSRDAARLLLGRARAAAPRRVRLAAAWRSDGPARLVGALPLPAAVRARVAPRRLLQGGVAALVLSVCIVPVPVVVKARASLEAERLQVVTAAEDGHVVAAHARPGDRVEAGDLLARLDDRAAALELEAYRSEAIRNAEELARALATRDRDALGELRARERRIEADLADAERRVERAAVRAPFDSVVLKGDPARRLGAPVAAGETLFELGSVERHRLVLALDEHDVRLVEPGMDARVRMAGAPGRAWRARLGELLPVAAVEPGTGAFRVPATLVEDGGALRAGMEGVARVRVGTAPLALAWTRALRERATLLAWRLGLIP